MLITTSKLTLIASSLCGDTLSSTSAATSSSNRCRSQAPNTSSGSLPASPAVAVAEAEGMDGMSGTKKDWSEMSASRARSSGAVGERSARRAGAWLRWAREERSSVPSFFTSSRVRVPPLERRFLEADAVAVGDADFAMAGRVGSGGGGEVGEGSEFWGLWT